SQYANSILHLIHKTKHLIHIFLHFVHSHSFTSRCRPLLFLPPAALDFTALQCYSLQTVKSTVKEEMAQHLVLICQIITNAIDTVPKA
ncbi:MAG: hypothetical protein IJ242_14655, partial [Clostridia bacterium]|nr:hypothetical protein [Clostridia bacterium]